MTKLTNEQIEQILEGAPEGFTHCANGRYLRLVEGEQMEFTDTPIETSELGSVGSSLNFEWDGKPVESLESLRGILSLRQEVERLRNPWISVEDELPEDNQDILMMDKTGKRFSGRGRVLKATNGYEDTSTAIHTKYTHWMPLPQPPKEQGHDDDS